MSASNMLYGKVFLGFVVGLVLILAMPALKADAAITYVQSATVASGSGTTVSKAFSSSTAAGNTIIVAVSWGNSSSISCADSQGNSYAVVTSAHDSVNNQYLGICYATNIVGGSDTVTVTFSSAASYHRLIISEYSGIATVNPVDAFNTNIADGTTVANNITSNSAVTTQSGDLIFGVVMDDTGTNNITAGTGFIQRASVNGKDMATQDMIQTAAGSVASTFTFSTNHRYLAQMVAFKR
jgi:hypothetical protein